MSKSGVLVSPRCRCHAVRAAILVRLWVKIPCPVQVLAPSRVSRRVLSHPYPRLRVLIRPSHPVRHLMVRRNARPVLEVLAGGTGSALAGDHDSADTEVGQRGVDGGLAVPAVCGHGARRAATALFDPCHGGGQLRCVGRVPGLHVVIEDDPVVVVGDLCLVAELDGFTEPALRDRPGLLVVQAHHPVRPIEGDPSNALAGLADDPGGRLQQVRQVVDGAGQPATPAPRGSVMAPGLGQLGCLDVGTAQRPLRVAQQSVRVTHGGLGQVGEFPGLRQHPVFDLVTTQLTTGAQFRGDRVRAFPGRPRPDPAPWCAPRRRRPGSAARSPRSDGSLWPATPNPSDTPRSPGLP